MRNRQTICVWRAQKEILRCVTEIVVFTRWSWRWHSDRGTECGEAFGVMHRDLCMAKMNIGGHDSLAIGQAEKAITASARGSRCLFHHASGEAMHRHFRHLQNEC